MHKKVKTGVSFSRLLLSADGWKIQHKFGVLPEELNTLRDLMESGGVEEHAMESTSIYWMPNG